MQTSFHSPCSSPVYLVALLGDRDSRREEGAPWREGEQGSGLRAGRGEGGALTRALLLQPRRTGKLVSPPEPLAGAVPLPRSWRHIYCEGKVCSTGNRAWVRHGRVSQFSGPWGLNPAGRTKVQDPMAPRE